MLRGFESYVIAMVVSITQELNANVTTVALLGVVQMVLTAPSFSLLCDMRACKLQGLFI